MELLIGLIVLVGLAGLAHRYFAAKSQEADREAVAPYKIETPVKDTTADRAVVTETVATPVAVKLKKPGQPKQATAKKAPVKKPVAKTTTKKSAPKKAPAKKPVAK